MNEYYMINSFPCPLPGYPSTHTISEKPVRGEKKIHFSGQYRQKNTKCYPKKSFGQKVSS